MSKTTAPIPSDMGILLTVTPRNDGSLELTINAIGSSIAGLITSNGVQTATGASVREVFYKDWQVVDEWMEYILKRQYWSSHNITAETPLSDTRLQFFRTGGFYAQVTITYYRGLNQVLLELQQMDTRGQSSRQRQQFKAAKKLWLSSFISQCGYWEIHIQSRTIYLTRQMAHMLKLAQDAVIAPLSVFLDLVHPEDLYQVVTSLDNVDATETVVVNRGILWDGSQVSFRSYAVAEYDDQGQMIHIIGCSQNITQHSRQQQMLQVLEQRFGSLADNGPHLVLVVDNEDKFSYVSQNIAAILGVDKKALLGQYQESLLGYLEETLSTRAEIESILEAKVSGQVKCRARVAEGALNWFVFHFVPVGGEDGQVAEMVIIGHNIRQEIEQQELTQYLKTHDPLTGAYNRVFFWQQMKQLQKEEGLDFCLVLVDINGLKLINDAFGNEKGDAILKEVVQMLRRYFGPQSRIFRMGSGEFAVQVLGAQPQEAEAMCERLAEGCRKTSRRMLPLSLSWGIGYSGDRWNAHGLFNLAQNRMYSHKLLERHSLHNQVTASLKEALKSRNLETADHVERMENMVTAMGKQLGLPGNEMDRLILLASLHDIGKLAVPDHVLNKPGKLTAEEMEIMRTHSEAGYRIAMTSQELSVIASEICCHHERWDGTGYPYGKKGEDIPLLSRIIAVVDAYDVMTHKRVYKDSINHQQAVEELRRCAGSQFDPAVVELFVGIFGGNRENSNFLEKVE